MSHSYVAAHMVGRGSIILSYASVRMTSSFTGIPLIRSDYDHLYITNLHTRQEGYRIRRNRLNCLIKANVFLKWCPPNDR